MGDMGGAHESVATGSLNVPVAPRNDAYAPCPHRSQAHPACGRPRRRSKDQRNRRQARECAASVVSIIYRACSRRRILRRILQQKKRKDSSIQFRYEFLEF
jgi:hypothetical protein